MQAAGEVTDDKADEDADQEPEDHESGRDSFLCHG